VEHFGDFRVSALEHPGDLVELGLGEDGADDGRESFGDLVRPATEGFVGVIGCDDDLARHLDGEGHGTRGREG
jgi:hypothetical protein